MEKHEQLGWNEPKREHVVPRAVGRVVVRVLVRQKEALAKHRRFIAELDAKKKKERMDKLQEEEIMKEREVGFGVKDELEKTKNVEIEESSKFRRS